MSSQKHSLYAHATGNGDEIWFAKPFSGFVNLASTRVLNLKTHPEKVHIQ